MQHTNMLLLRLDNSEFCLEEAYFITILDYNFYFSLICERIFFFFFWWGAWIK